MEHLKKNDETKDKHGNNSLEIRAKEMLADDDGTENGSNISRLVTTQGALMKEILRAKKGITAMKKTDFCDRNNTHIHTPDAMRSLYLLRVFIRPVCKRRKLISRVHPGIRPGSVCKCVVCAELRPWRSRTLLPRQD